MDDIRSVIILKPVINAVKPYVLCTAKYMISTCWVTQKLPQICTVILRIRIGKVEKNVAEVNYSLPAA